MQPIVLAQGNLAAAVNSASGSLHRVSVDGECVVYRVFAAFRDRTWDTPEPEVTLVAQSADRLVIRSDYAATGYGLVATTTISIAERSIRVGYRAEVTRELERSRLGLCVLLPGTLGGTPVEVGTTPGGRAQIVLPTAIAPRQPCTDVASLGFVISDAKVSIAFEGEPFEMEDQRNWTDFSYKVYCTPLDLPRPVRLPPGSVVEQAVTVTVDSISRRRPQTRRTSAAESRTVTSLPLLGARLVPGERPLPGAPGSDAELPPLDFVRIDLWPDVPAGALRATLAMAPDLPLLAYDWADDRPATDAPFAGRRILRRAAADPATGSLRAPAAGRAGVVVGTDGGFAELNRQRPVAPPGCAVAVSANPQVHDFDDEAVIDNLLGFRAVLDSALALYPDRPLVLGLVELVPHNNPAAGDRRGNALRGRPEPRMESEFALAWGFAAYCEAAAAGVESIALFDVSGEFGLMSPDGARPASRLFADIRRLSDTGGPFTVTLPPATIAGVVGRAPAAGGALGGSPRRYRLAGPAFAVLAALSPDGVDYRTEVLG